MSQIYADGKIKRIYAVGHGLIKKGYACYGQGNTALIYSSSSTVTYVVDTDVSYKEEVESGVNALNPTTFTPSKSGYTFVGWREDTLAPTGGDYVLTEKIAREEPITLYACFKKTVTVSYNGNGSTSGSTASESKSAYYNNGNTWNPSFTLKSNGFSKTNYKFANWRMGSASGTAYSAGASVTISENTTFYAYWIASTLTVAFNDSNLNHWSGGDDDVATSTADLTHYTKYKLEFRIDKQNSGSSSGTIHAYLNGSLIKSWSTSGRTSGTWYTEVSSASIPTAARKAGVQIKAVASGGNLWNGYCRFTFS